eukprot:11932617-Alexandrium_andersonii.AAC.1
MLAGALGNSVDKDLVGLQLEAGLTTLLSKPKEAKAAHDRPRTAAIRRGTPRWPLGCPAGGGA